MCIIDTKPRSFTQSEIEIVASFAKLICDEMELREIAGNDGLTGTLTRRSWISAAYREFDATRRKGDPVSIIMFDIDYFKSINDTHGHGVGDTVLREIATRCIGQSRDGDLLGRIGGEEFALLLPSTCVSKAAEVADRLRRSIGGRPIALNHGEIPVTASFGIGARKPPLQTPEDLLNYTDVALYAAKQNGRDCCIVR